MRVFATISVWDHNKGYYKTSNIISDTNEFNLFHNLKENFGTFTLINDIMEYENIDIIRSDGEVEYYDVNNEFMTFNDIDEIDEYSLDNGIINNYIFDGRVWRLNGYTIDEYEQEFLDESIYSNDDDDMDENFKDCDYYDTSDPDEIF